MSGYVNETWNYSDFPNEMLLHIDNAVWYVNLNGIRECSPEIISGASSAEEVKMAVEYDSRRERAFCAPLNRGGSKREGVIFALGYRYFMRYGEFIPHMYGSVAVVYLEHCCELLGLEYGERIKSGKYVEDKRKYQVQHSFRSLISTNKQSEHPYKLAGDREANAMYNKFVGISEYICMDLPDYSIWDINYGYNFYDFFKDWMPMTFTKVYFAHGSSEDRKNVLDIFTKSVTRHQYRVGKAVGMRVRPYMAYEDFAPIPELVAREGYDKGLCKAIMENPLFGSVGIRYFDPYSRGNRDSFYEIDDESRMNWLNLVADLSKPWAKGSQLPWRYVKYRRIDGKGARNHWRFLDISGKSKVVMNGRVESWKFLYSEYVIFRKFGYRVPEIVGYSYDEEHIFGKKGVYGWQKMLEERGCNEILMPHFAQFSYWETQFSGNTSLKTQAGLPEMFFDFK